MKNCFGLFLLYCAVFCVYLNSFASHASHQGQNLKIIETNRLGDLVNNVKPQVSEEAPRGKDVEDKLVFHRRPDGSVSLGLTPKQTCDICHTTYDTGIVLLRRGLTINQLPAEQREEIKAKYGIQFLSSAQFEPTTGKLMWPSDSMAQEICETSLAQYKPHYTVGCHQLLAVHHENIWKPYQHKSASAILDSPQQVLENKLDFCIQSHSCTASAGLIEEERPTPDNTPARTPCGACIELANDNRVLFKRLMTTIPNPENNPNIAAKCAMHPNQFNAFANMWCQSLNMRHFKPEDLQPTCDRMIDPSIREAFYELVKDGNRLHRFLKEPKIWEQSLCVELSGLCTQEEYDETYQMWENAAEFDYNLTVANHLLDKQLSSHKTALDALEHEYLYTDKHMYAPDQSTMTESELLEYKENAQLNKKMESLNESEEHSLEALSGDVDVVVDPEQDIASLDRENDSEFDSSLQDEDIVSPALGQLLLGRLSHVNSDGIRVPNELPPHKLREYKAKRHKALHDAQTATRIQGLRSRLEDLYAKSPSYHDKRRVWALPDSLFVSPWIADIITNILELERAKKRGKAADDLIQQTYEQQLREMKEFSANFSQEEYQQLFDLDDSGNDLDEHLAASTQGNLDVQVEINNEAISVAEKIASSQKDEL